MVATIPFNYMPQVNAAGAFTTSTSGVVQGVQTDDPETRWSLRSGVLAQTETLPMWGGVLIYENVPNLAAGNPDSSLGSTVGRATTLTATSTGGASGFALFNQAHFMPLTAQSPVPMSASGMAVHYQRLGSGARIAVAADPDLVSLEGGVVGANVSWDFNNQLLQPYDASTATFAINTATWSANVLTVVMTAALPVTPAAGDKITISGATNSGTGGAAAINTTFTVLTGTDTSHFTLSAPAASGVFGTIGGSPVVNMGTGALLVRVDAVLPTGCMTVSYNPTTGFASWNYNGCCAIITI